METLVKILLSLDVSVVIVAIINMAIIASIKNIENVSFLLDCWLKYSAYAVIGIIILNVISFIIVFFLELLS